MSATAPRSAWDYGLPQSAVEVVDRAIREGVGSAAMDGFCFEVARTGSRVHVPNMAAAIVYDLIMSGQMNPAVPDIPPIERPPL